jgi:hypothetical protein
VCLCLEHRGSVYFYSYVHAWKFWARAWIRPCMFGVSAWVHVCVSEWVCVCMCVCMCVYMCACLRVFPLLGHFCAVKFAPVSHRYENVRGMARACLAM